MTHLTDIMTDESGLSQKISGKTKWSKALLPPNHKRVIN